MLPYTRAVIVLTTLASVFWVAAISLLWANLDGLVPNSLVTFTTVTAASATSVSMQMWCARRRAASPAEVVGEQPSAAKIYELGRQATGAGK